MSSQKVLSSVNMNLFTPCLVFSKLASTLSLDSMGDLWALPLLFAILSFTSWAAAVGSVWVTNYFSSGESKLGPRENRFIQACSIFQNVISPD